MLVTSLLPCSTSEDPVDDAVLVVSELATNAVRHSSSGSAGGWFVVIVGFGERPRAHRGGRPGRRTRTATV